MCYGLTGFCPKFMCWRPTLQCDYSGDRVFEEWLQLNEVIRVECDLIELVPLTEEEETPAYLKSLQVHYKIENSELTIIHFNNPDN